MHLIIDSGNTRHKLSLFSTDGRFIEARSTENSPWDLIASLKNSYSIKKAIIASVRKAAPEMGTTLKQAGIPFLELNAQTPTPVENAYKTPQSLGYDRLAAAVGAQALFPGQAALIVDLGTAVTYDYITEEGTFAGGNIAPGMHMRFRALHEFTANLPGLKAPKQVPGLGYDTTSSIQAGVVQGIVHEIEGYARYIRKKNPNARILLTGGDAIYFDKILKLTIFVQPNLVAAGLNRILEYNAHAV